MPRRTGLGRGLDALIPGEDNPPQGGILEVPVGQIRPNPRQPRGMIDPTELAELAASIQEHGVIQPIVVTVDPENSDLFVLIAGERRWLAAQLARLDTIPILIREASEQQRLELALVENIQRADLAPLETAEAYRQLADDFGLSHEEIARKVFRSRSAITNTLRLLKLPQDVKTALAEEKISEGHARALLALATSQAQSAALHTIIAHNLNVRQTEELVRKLSGERPVTLPRPPLPAEMVAVEERLRHHLGTKVRLTHHSKGGKIVIHYYSDEELDSLVAQLLGKE